MKIVLSIKRDAKKFPILQHIIKTLPSLKGQLKESMILGSKLFTSAKLSGFLFLISFKSLVLCCS